MNYPRMIMILQLTKELRSAKKNISPYVCDNLEECLSDRCTAAFSVIEEIKADIRMYINNEWGVAEYMNKNCPRPSPYTNCDIEVLNFRAEMIDNLIQRYKDKLNEVEV